MKSHNAWGISATGSFGIFEKTENFTRYDHSFSTVSSVYNRPWNYLLDGSFKVIGVQYTFNENVKIALDYQSTIPYNPGNMISDSIFLNARFKF